MTVIFLKMGGSLITDKTRVEHARWQTIRRLAREVQAAREACPEMQLVLGHGSGSFGHVAAQRHGTRAGVEGQSGWLGFAKVAAAAARLNQIVIDVFVQAGVPVISLPPSVLAQCEDGALHSLEVATLWTALARGLVPVVYGDVAFDAVRGGTIISTEDEFAYLARTLRPRYILLAGEVDGVYESAELRGQVVPVITPENAGQYLAGLGGSHGADVTGGMAAKVRQMLELVQEQPEIEARIFSGVRRGNVRRLLSEPETPIGTAVRS